SSAEKRRLKLVLGRQSQADSDPHKHAVSRLDAQNSTTSDPEHFAYAHCRHCKMMESRVDRDPVVGIVIGINLFGVDQSPCKGLVVPMPGVIVEVRDRYVG